MCATRLVQGHAAEALELAQRENLPDFRLLGIALVQHTLGNKDASDTALQQLGDSHGNEAAYQFAEACGWRGEIDRAFEWLERAYTQRDPGWPRLAATRSFARCTTIPVGCRSCGKWGSLSAAKRLLPAKPGHARAQMYSADRYPFSQPAEEPSGRGA
jgi:hypothetical protein